jgi:hypothetical protein
MSQLHTANTATSPKLDTTNIECMTYQTEEISFTLLGGIKLDGLDRMRVTLKIEVINRKFKHYLNNPDLADLALRQNLDLYNDTQVEKLIRKAAERLEVGSTSLAQSIADITNQLEIYRLEKIKEQEIKPEINKPLTEAEHQAARAFLTAPDLLSRTNAAIGQSGVIGEESNRLLMYLIFTSRKLSHPLHVISLGSSGTGKTHLQEKVAELIPEEDKLEITTLSENAFYYFGKTELSHKLILIEDLDGALNVLFPLRELQSKKRISKTVTFKDSRGLTKTITLTVEGPVSVAGCTTKERIYEDNANRSFLIYLDESSEQDNKIMQYQRELAAGLINTEAQEHMRRLLCNCQKVLQPVKVVNPYAPYLQLPKEVFKPRRTNKHYLDFIEAVTFYHQLQRPQQVDTTTGEVYIQTTLDDIAEANKLMKSILLRKSDNLSGACRNYFEQLKQWLQQESKSSFTNREARTALNTGYSAQKHFMSTLQQGYYINKQETTGDKKNGYQYEIVSPQEYEQLKARISHVLDEILQKIQTQEVNQLKEVQTANGTTLNHAQQGLVQEVPKVTGRTMRTKKNNTNN